MSFNRLRYDQGAYQHQLAESVGPGVYVTAVPRPDCRGACAPSDPYVRMQKACPIAASVDVSSDLERLPWPATKCPESQYLPGRGVKDPRCQAAGASGRTCAAAVEDTRLSNPPCTLRGTGWNRFDPLKWNPQDYVLEPWAARARDGVSYRLVAKDNHRPCLPSRADVDRACGGDAFGASSATSLGPPQAYPQPSADVPNYTWQSCEAIGRM